MNIIYLHLYEPTNLPVGIEYVAIDSLNNYDNNSIQEIFITDLLDYYHENLAVKILSSILDKLQPGGKLHIQSTDLYQLSHAILSSSIDENTAKSILYPNKKSIYSMYNIETVLTQNNLSILEKRYINVCEYFILAQKDEN